LAIRFEGDKPDRHRSAAQASQAATAAATIDDMDVSEQGFQTAVIERSHAVPVVVDFWASWCGPCLRLGPVLERAVAARAGKVELAKVDVDASPGLAAAYGVQGIPAVKGFRDGEVIAEFTGTQPPALVERFLDGLLPSEADGLVERGDEESLRRALELEPRRADAALALARILHARGESEEALSSLQAARGSFAADGLAARIALEHAPADADLPGVSEAFAALDAGDRRRALDLLIAALTSADGAREDLRRVIVGVLDELGVEDPLARETRRRLAAALY
jgi:putative thioredoxin